MKRPRPKQEPHRRCAVGEGGGDALQADLGDLVNGKWQHMCRQSIAEARQRIDQRCAMGIIVHQQDCLLPAGFAIGDQHGAQFAHQHIL